MDTSLNTRLDQWRKAPSELKIFTDEAHFWLIDLRQPRFEVDQMTALLSQDEYRRMKRLRRAKNKTEFAIAHGALRDILGRYLQLPPGDIQFQFEYHHKPMIYHEINKVNLDFNLSHSAGYALIGIAKDRSVGVDIEFISGERQHSRIPERFFSIREVKSLRSLPEDRQLDAFFAAWTRKEAYVKAKGWGLLLALAEFSVTIAPNEKPALLEMKSDPGEIHRWSLLDIKLPDGYRGAAAVEGKLFNTFYFLYNGI